jgi:hypothetical protein
MEYKEVKMIRKLLAQSSIPRILFVFDLAIGIVRAIATEAYVFAVLWVLFANYK